MENGCCRPNIRIFGNPVTLLSVMTSMVRGWMTGTGAGIRSPRGGTGEQGGTCGAPRRGAGRASASVGRVRCGFWKMRESSK